jgi:hypothetical protein
MRMHIVVSKLPPWPPQNSKPSSQFLLLRLGRKSSPILIHNEMQRRGKSIVEKFGFVLVVPAFVQSC